jgi:hypothetical protein
MSSEEAVRLCVDLTVPWLLCRRGDLTGTA